MARWGCRGSATGSRFAAADGDLWLPPRRPGTIVAMRALRPPSHLVPIATSLAGVALALLLYRAAGTGISTRPDDDLRRAAEVVFDTSVLHAIEISVDEEQFEKLDEAGARAVPCTFTFDGRSLRLVGIRRKGGMGSLSPLFGKPALSVEFNEFIRGQRLFGLDRLILNNGMQDAAFLNEHLGYEICRRAGLAAPLTAHALVTINGELRGLYVLREAIDRRFLERNFGAGNGSGNLYEGSCPFDVPCTDFLRMPERMELRQESKRRRGRDDLRELVRAIRTSSGDAWITETRRRLDLTAFITLYAVCALTNHWDSYSGNMNNYYLYHRPSDGRFVMLPHGMDSLFGVDGMYQDIPVADPRDPPAGLLAEKVWGTPATRSHFEVELRRVLDKAWNVELLLERTERVERLLAAVPDEEPRLLDDLIRFEEASVEVRRFISTRRAVLEPAVD
jgi:spore coat protein CotH